jgi:hypothetical protein
VGKASVGGTAFGWLAFCGIVQRPRGAGAALLSGEVGSAVLDELVPAGTDFLDAVEPDRGGGLGEGDAGHAVRDVPVVAVVACLGEGVEPGDGGLGVVLG